jgi:prepilin-type N-terminal cleavage/methylation domain-containing protein
MRLCLDVISGYRGGIKRRNSQTGYTMLELVVVLAIVCVLIALLLIFSAK